MNTRIKLAVTAALAASAMVGHHDASAQEAPEEQPAGGLEEIVVVAQKRSESLQQVPIAATALTQEALEVRFVKDFTDISGALPNASLESEGISNYASSFYIRGQGTQNRGPFVDPAVSVVVDGIAGGYVATALTDMIDVEAIEVLRGPQGTLQGRNSTGGAILVRHFRPDPSGEDANFGLLFGSDGRQDVSVMLNAPIGDSAAVRVAGKWTETDGFYTNEFNGGNETVGGQERLSLMPSIYWEGENLDVTLRGTLNSYDDDSAVLIPRYACRVDPRIDPASLLNDTYVRTIALRYGGAQAIQYCGRPASSNMFNVNQNRPIDAASLDQLGVTGEVNYRFTDVGTMTLVANYQDNEEISAVDVDGTFEQINSNQENTRHHQMSGELRFASDFSEAIDFVAGIFYLDQHYDLRRVTKVDGTPTALTPTINTLNGGSSQNNTQSGAFAQANWHITDALTAVAGARYTKDEKDILICGTAAAICNGRLQYNEEEWSDTSPRVGLNYQLNDQTFFYGYWAKGFRAGGFNGEAGSASAAGPFDPEDVTTYEIGAKFDTWENRLRFNAAIFYTEAEDLQRQLSRATAAGTAEIVTQNAAAAEFQGAELEITAVPLDGLTLSASIGYLDAKYTDYCTDLNGIGLNDPSLVACAPPTVVTGGVIQPVDLTDLPIARTPDLTARVGVVYTFAMGDSGDLSLAAEWAHQDEELTLDGGAPVGTTLGIVNFDGSKIDPMRPATDIINASISWKAAEHYKVAIYGKNLTDELYFRRLSFASPTLSFGTLANPREYGVQLEYHY